MDMSDKKVFCFDIDGVIMTITKGNDYMQARPIEETVDMINYLFEKGHHIILFTARGYITKIDWESLTIKQLENAGVKYHELKFGKPAADYYIDDKMLDLKLLNEKIKNNNF
jgi:CMP-N,N'-diacetyllegionaminic acid synthase